AAAQAPAHDDAWDRLDGLYQDNPNEGGEQHLRPGGVPGDGYAMLIDHGVEAQDADGIERCPEQQDDEPRQRVGDDELRADGAGQEADDGLGQPADANDAARQRVLRHAGGGAGQHARGRPELQGGVDDHDQHQIDCTASGPDEGDHGRLQGQRGDDGG